MNLDLKWPIELAQRFAIVKSIKQRLHWWWFIFFFYVSSHIATVLPSALSPGQIKSTARDSPGARLWDGVVVVVGVGVGVGVEGKSKANRSAIMSRTWNWVGCGQSCRCKRLKIFVWGHQAPSSGIGIGASASGIVIDISTAQLSWDDERLLERIRLIFIVIS